MFFKMSHLILLLPLPLAAAAGGQDTKDASLDGIWKLTASEVDGEAEELPAVARWVIKGTKVHYGGEDFAVLTLDPQTTPRSVDLTLTKQKRTHEAIYAIEGDTLKICVSLLTDGVKERPAGFATKGKADWRLLVFKREKAGTDELEGVSGFVGIQLRAKDKQIQIADVLKDMPAEKAGLKKDDVLLKIGAAEVTELRQTVDQVRQAKPRTELMIRVQRGDKDHDITVKVGVLPFFLLDP
jgi:uncharacterized protein (TIGR03067 family)